MTSVFEISSEHLEDEYKVFYNSDLAMVTVRNLSPVYDQCIFNLLEVEEDIQRAFHEQNWERFICELIGIGYLD